jgi:hypothetical protein
VAAKAKSITNAATSTNSVFLFIVVDLLSFLERLSLSSGVGLRSVAVNACARFGRAIANCGEFSQYLSGVINWTKPPFSSAAIEFYLATVFFYLKQLCNYVTPSTAQSWCSLKTESRATRISPYTSIHYPRTGERICGYHTHLLSSFPPLNQGFFGFFNVNSLDISMLIILKSQFWPLQSCNILTLERGLPLK